MWRFHRFRLGYVFYCLFDFITILLIVEYSCYQPNMFLFFQAQWGCERIQKALLCFEDQITQQHTQLDKYTAKLQQLE